MMAEILTSKDRVRNSFHPLPLPVSPNPSILGLPFLAEIEKGEAQSGRKQDFSGAHNKWYVRLYAKSLAYLRLSNHAWLCMEKVQ